MKALAVATQGKGSLQTVRRARAIGTRYGFGPDRMDERLATVYKLVEHAGCQATLPVTAVVVARHPHTIARYAALGIEFPVHGYLHVDHSALTLRSQLERLARARRLLARSGVVAVGFRAPYLRCHETTRLALVANGFLYDASQAVHWPLPRALESAPYRRALDFYGAISADDAPVVPWIEDGLVRLPYVLPDDEAVVDRLGIGDVERMTDLWLGILRATHERHELFTLAVHPERIDICGRAVVAVLEAARRMSPSVWIASHEEIARWWRDRTRAQIAISESGDGRLRVTARGPRGLTMLARGLDIDGAGSARVGETRVPDNTVELATECRPFIGVHPRAPSALTDFLREQGYIVERSPRPRDYGTYLTHERFARTEGRSLLAQIEAGDRPLLRFGRWPDGAQCALSVTGDVDALTIRDYALRALGR